MVLMLEVIVFVAQLICCVCFKDKVKKYLPTLIAAVFISVTVLSANLGQLDPERLVAQTKVILAGILAVAVYHTIHGVRSVIAARRDPAQKLRK